MTIIIAHKPINRSDTIGVMWNHIICTAAVPYNKKVTIFPCQSAPCTKNKAKSIVDCPVWIPRSAFLNTMRHNKTTTPTMLFSFPNRMLKILTKKKQNAIGYQILIFRHYHIPPWYPIHLPSQIPIYQSLISHIIHHKYENFYPPSIDLKFKIGGFFYFQKKLKNFCSEGVQNASPSSNK